MVLLKQRKTRARRGFTLMEMLIVIAIIAVLIAIAVPVFNSQTTRAKIETDNANLRTAQAVAMAKFMDGEHATGTHKNGWFYNDTEEYYGYYFDPATATCVCDGTNSKTGTRDEARYLEGHGYGQTPSLRAKAGGSLLSHENQFILVGISTDGSKMLAGWTYHGFNCMYVNVLPETYVNPDDYIF